MKKLGLVLLLPACLQQGLVADPNAITDETSTTTTGVPSNPVPEIKLTPRSSTTFIRTDFGDRAYTSSKPIVGFGEGDLGETFCFSNERKGGENYDIGVQCRKPLSSENNLPSEEDDLADMLTSEVGANSGELGTIIQAIQLYFSNTINAPSNNFYSKITGLKVSVKSAPLLFNKSTGEFTWDNSSGKVLTFNYAGSCNLSDDNTVGFDISADSSLGTAAERTKYFLTGLWVFERGLTKPYESSTKSPIGPYPDGFADGPHSLFSTRTNIFASLLIPSYDEVSTEYGFQYFPGDNSNPTNAPSEDPLPFKYTMGYYTGSTVNSSTGPSVPVSDNANTIASVEGAIITPVMGKFGSDTQLVTASNGSGTAWDRRVITGLCVSGNRAVYNGSATEIGTYPVIHALKYQLRKIKVILN